MPNPDSRAEGTGNPTGASSHYGCAQYGASWDEADCALVLIHGRDRDVDELPIRVVGAPATRRAKPRLLAPFTASKSWYAGRYDAPRRENAAALEAGLACIEDALDLALTNGVPATRIVIAGFSQGGCMTVEYLMAGSTTPAAAAIFTGSALDLPNRDPASADLTGLPVVLSGGSVDPWLPVRDLIATGALLEAAGADVHTEIFPDGEHAVRDPEISLLGQLLERVAA